MPDRQGNTVSFEDAPAGAELNLDDLFGNPEVQPTTTVTPTPEPTATTQDDAPFLKTATGTVYKTADEAARGVEHKDALIAQLRQQLSDTTGNDPLKKSTQQSTQNGQPKSYLEDKDAYFRDMSRAVEAKDQEKYLEVQRKFVYDSIAPLAPTITALVKTQAANTVESEIKDFRQFQSSDEYSKTLDSFPLLKQAISLAESSPEAASQLPEFYKMAYLANQGARLPEIVRSQRRDAAEVGRPTVTSTPITPTNTTGQSVAAPSLNTREGRKAIIEQQQRAGIEDLKF